MDLASLLKQGAASLPIIGSYYGVQNAYDKAAKSNGATYDYNWIPGIDNSNNTGTGASGSNSRANFSVAPTTAAPGAKVPANDFINDQQLDFGGAFGGSGGGVSAADEAAAYGDQISNLDRLLGIVNAQSATGLTSLQERLGSEKARLGEQKTKTFAGYDSQALENAQNKQKGVETVDQFAGDSIKGLQRLLGGANAGNSSVARELIPYLVSKSAGTRRANVFDTAGKNDQSIATARGNAQDEFRYSEEDLNNQANQQEQNYRQQILSQQNDLESQKRDLTVKRGMANGLGYGAARAGAASSDASINDRTAQLTNLFSQFKPTFTARAMNLQAPELGQYTVDRAQINSQNQGLPAESSYYQQQLKKKQQEQV